MSAADYPGFELDALRGEIMQAIDHRPDLAYALIHTALALAQLSAAIALVALAPPGSPWRLLAFVVMGFSQYRLFFPLHDACHKSLFPTTGPNRLLGNLLSGALFTTFGSFTTVHIQHHRWLGDRRDAGSVDYFVHFANRGELVRFFLRPLLGINVLEKVWLYLVEPFLRGRGGPAEANAAQRDQVPPPTAAELACTAAVQAVIFLAISRLGARPLDYVLFYFLPAATIFPFLMRLRMYLEHGPLDYAVSDYLGANRRSIARTFTRSVIERPLFSFMNFRFHREHHIVPGLPSVRLPEVHERFVRDRLDPDDACPTYRHALGKIARLV